MNINKGNGGKDRFELMMMNSTSIRVHPIETRYIVSLNSIVRRQHTV